MPSAAHASWIAFSGSRRIALGAPREVAADVKRYFDAHPAENVLVLDAATGRPVEIDLRGSLSAVLQRLPAAREEAPVTVGDAPAAPARAVGRPRLGVTAREVTLLPRHWEWLSGQPGGASVALRKLVEHALRGNRDADRLRLARESAYRFMAELAGDSPGFEEATRALFAGDVERLKQIVSRWPADVRDHTLVLVDATVATSGG